MLVSGFVSSYDPCVPHRYMPGRPGQLQSTGCHCAPGARGETASISEFGALAVAEVTERLQCLGPVWKQIEARLLISLHPDAAAAYQMVDPMGFDAHRGGHLRDRQGARYPSGA